MPYITASIIMELLAATFPNLAQMERDGMKPANYPLCDDCDTVVQAIGVSVGLQHMDKGSAILILETVFGLDALFFYQLYQC